MSRSLGQRLTTSVGMPRLVWRSDIRRAWYREGFRLWRRRMRECFAPAFFVWKAYSAYRALLRVRQATLHREFVAWHYADHPVLFRASSVKESCSDVHHELATPTSRSLEHTKTEEAGSITSGTTESVQQAMDTHRELAQDTTRSETSVVSEASTGAWFAEVALKVG